MTTTTQGASERITEAVTAWPGVVAGTGSRGEWGFNIGRRSIGHVHGDRVAHFAFPRDVRAELMAAGRVGPHPIDKPGLAARRIEGEADVLEVIELMRMNYDRAVANYGVPGTDAA